MIRFIERYCRVPEGSLVGQPMRLLEFQRRFITEIYDNPAGTRRAYLSIGRKNGKTALIAALVLAHLVGPEARLNTQILSGARSRDQAAHVFKLARKMAALNPDLSKLVKVTPSSKALLGLTMNVEYMALSAEAGTAHGYSPVLAILDEVGQVKGPYDGFIEAIETAQGAHDAPLLIAISTQAPAPDDLFSIWLDDAAASADPHIVSHAYSAPEDCDLDDRAAWLAANPALGVFRSEDDVAQMAAKAIRLPTAESSFRLLFLNQRVSGDTPFVSRSTWQGCGGDVVDSFEGREIYAGLDLSEVSDLTALVRVANVDGGWHVKPTFWLPSQGLAERARQDRQPYDVWFDKGLIETTPGPTIQYEWVAQRLFDLHQREPFKRIAFDMWNYRHLKPWLAKAGFADADLDGDDALFKPFGQGFKSMSPALRTLEGFLLDGRIAHGAHPVLAMCAANATAQVDAAGNRKLNKIKSHGRIDGLVAMAMAVAVAAEEYEGQGPPVPAVVFL